MALYETGSTKGVQPNHVTKLRQILTILDVASLEADLAIPYLKAHALSGKLAGRWSVTVNGNWRVTFEFAKPNVILVDYEDYH